MNNEHFKPGLDILGIGMSTLDFLQVVPDFPECPGVTQSLETCLMGGGPVPTALCAASRLGATTGIIDRIGDDWRGRLVVEDYARFGVRREFLLVEDGKTTTFSSVLVRQRDGERHFVFTPGDFSPLSEEALPGEALKSCKVLHLNGRHWAACLEAARVVRGAGGAVSFDGGAGRYDPKFRELLEVTDIAIVARDFAARLAGSGETHKQLGVLRELGARIAGITHGEKGSWFATADGEVFHQPAFAMTDVVDTTGCGDAFHGGFLYAWCQGWSPRESALFASAVAAANTLKLGGRGNLPDLAATRKLIDGASFFLNF